MGPTGPGREIDLNRGQTLSLGRHPNQTVQLLDRLCSKEHAVVKFDGSQWYVEDLGSRNGTYVNRNKVEKRHELSGGDRLLIGNTELLFVDENYSIEPMIGAATRVTILPGIRAPNISTALQHRPDSDNYRPVSVINDTSQLRKDYERLRTAWKLQRDIALEVDLDVLLSKIMNSLFEAMPCDRGAILLRDDQTDELVTRFVHSKQGGAHSEIRISRTLIEQVLEQKVAFQSNDLTVDNRLDPSDSIIATGVRSSLSVPLVTRTERVLGIIHLDSLFSTHAFTEGDLEVVKGLANQAALAIENSILIAQREEQLRVRERFSRLLSPALVEELVSGKVEIAPGGQSHETTVLFTDIRGFTSMSQRLEAQDIVRMLNEHFESMVDIVFEFEGTLDKYLGDGLMALWGVPLAVTDGPFKAVAAAVAMRDALAEYNAHRLQNDLEALNIGIGVDTGRLVAGYMGSSRTMNYTVIGPPVNLASRLCGAAKATQILISDNTLSALGDRITVETLEEMELKGIGRVAPHNVVSLKPQAGE